MAQLQSIKTSTFTVAHMQANQTIQASQLVEYRSFSSSTIEYIFSNINQCPADTYPTETPSNNILKQMIIDNIELFILLVITFYIISMVCVIKLYKRRNTAFEQIIQLRKESLNDENWNSRKTSQSYDPASSNPRSNTSEEGILNLNMINNPPLNEKSDKYSSTESSPRNPNSGIIGDRSNNESSLPLKRTQFDDLQIEPYDVKKNVTTRQNIYKQLGQVQERVPFEGQTLRTKREQKVEVEKDNVRNVIKKTETQTIITEFQVTHETEEQLKQMGDMLSSQVEDINNQKILRNSFRGLRVVEEEDHQQKTTFQTLEFVTELSQQCENGKFSKMYLHRDLIGKGTYGEVFRARRVLDQKFCAIKRTFFSVNEETNIYQHKISREIEALQTLNHPNIVRCYSTWIEELESTQLMKIRYLANFHNQKRQKQQQHQQAQKSLTSISSFNNNENLDYLDDCVQFFQPEGVSQKSSVTQNSIMVSKQSVKPESLRESHQPLSELNSSEESFINRFQFKPSINTQYFALHIEMELCEKNTLREFIDNVDRSQDYKLIQNIFLQLMQGVNYMHHSEFIHRDLKPGNIFLTQKMQVKIGDLGLATTNAIIDSYEKKKGGQNSDQSRTSNIGTPFYMAPEVKELDQYGTKADIYALGIIYFELLQKMNTNHERVRLINELVNNNILPVNFTKKYSEEASLIFKMTSKKPEKRPNAAQIIEQLQKH